jgi:transcriptional regulator with XRE-family HTH domain
MTKQKLIYPNVKAELARLGANETELAEFMGMTRQNLGNKLRGKTKLTAKDMKAIQEYFIANGGNAFTLDYLFYNL